MSRLSVSSPGGAFGQAGIAVRVALLAGDAAGAADAARELDPDHAVEILLGGLIRRGDVSGVSAWLAGDAAGVCARLARPQPTPLDDAAVGYVVRRLAPEVWRAEGPGAVVTDMASVARALRHGCGGRALLDALRGRALHDGVRAYYEAGRIHALGVRPLLILAGS